MGTESNVCGVAMGASYRLDADRRLVLTTLAGVVTEDDLDGLENTMSKDPAFDPTWPVLVNATHLDPAAISAEGLRYRAAQVRPLHHRVAVVAPADVVFGLARMFQMLTEGNGNQIEVFRTPREALAWLGVEPHD